MKSEGRTDKELEESYCFLLTDTYKVRCPINFIVSCLFGMFWVFSYRDHFLIIFDI